jgi:hypothetical protein
MTATLYIAHFGWDLKSPVRAHPDPHRIGLIMNILPINKQIAIIASLVEGCSIRSVERLTGVHRDTIMRLGVRVGFGCAAFHDSLMRDVQVPRIELDETLR